MYAQLQAANSRLFFSCEFWKLFSRSISTEEDLLELITKSKYDKQYSVLVSKNNEFVAFSSDEVRFGFHDTSFPDAIQIIYGRENKTVNCLLYNG